MQLNIIFVRHGEDFIAESRRLEDALFNLGRITLNRGGGIAQIRLETELGADPVCAVVKNLSLNGRVTVSEDKDDEEMEPE